MIYNQEDISEISFEDITRYSIASETLINRSYISEGVCMCVWRRSDLISTLISLKNAH